MRLPPNVLRIIGQCPSIANEKVAVIITEDQVIWLANTTAQDIHLGPSELFGFNAGSFTEKPKGLIAACQNGLAFLVSDDRQALVHSRDGAGKVLTCLAQLAHWLTTTAGFTDMSLVDHDLSPQTAPAPNSVSVRRAYQMDCFRR